MVRSAFLFVIITLFLFSCENNSVTKPQTNSTDVHQPILMANEFKLVGSTFTNDISRLYLYKKQQDTLQFIDTLKIKNRLFTYKGIYEEPEFYSLKMDPKTEGFIFLVDNSQIDIALNNTINYSSTYAESDLQKAYNTYVKTLDSFSTSKQTLLNKYAILNTSAVKKIKAERLKISKDRSSFIKAFITSHHDTKLAALLINDYKTIFSIKDVRALYDTLAPSIKNLAYSKDLHTAITKIEDKFNTDVAEASTSGSYRINAFDISGPNPEGVTISLNSIPKGKVILVDFWASWCGPCRVANPNIVRLYNTYKDRGFEVLSVSEDRGESEWINAIASDNLLWPYHILDKNKSIAFRYGVESIPFNLLIDKQGRIASEKLSGHKLEQRIQQLLNE